MNRPELDKILIADDTKEVAATLESLDLDSRILARTYLTALVERQNFEETRKAQVV